MFVIGAIPQPVAVLDPALMIVAKAVADVPTFAERLLGRTADTTDVVAGRAG